MSRNQPQYDHWLNKWKMDPAYRVRVYELLMALTVGVWLGFMLGRAVFA